MTHSLLYEIAEKIKALLAQKMPELPVQIAAAPVITNRDFPVATLLIIPYGFPSTQLMNRDPDYCATEVEFMIGLVKYDLGEWSGTRLVDELVQTMEQVVMTVFAHDFHEDDDGLGAELGDVLFKELVWDESYDVQKLLDANTFSSYFSVVYMTGLERAGATGGEDTEVM